MRQAEVKQKFPPEASDRPMAVRLVSEPEFDSIEDLRLENSRRVGEIKAMRLDLEKTIEEKRRAQDLLVTYHQEIIALRLRGVQLEQKVANDRAKWEGLDSAITQVLTLWAMHGEDCDDGCVAAVHVPRDFALMFEGHGVGGDKTLIPAEKLLLAAIEDREDDVIRMAATALASAIREDVTLRWRHCGCPTDQCDPCSTHECCVNVGESCAWCVNEEYHSIKADREYDAAKGGDR